MKTIITIIFVTVVMNKAYSQGKFYSGNGSGNASQTIVNLPLPVSLTFFLGKLDSENVKLSWQTASEMNNQGFVIERKLDGMQFDSIGFNKGAGTSSQINNYVFLDVKPPVGTYYYRLKQLDYDGKIEYSKIVKVVVKTTGIVSQSQQIRIFPNPTTGVVNIHFYENSLEPPLKIYSSSGKLLFEFSDIPKQINLKDLDTGFYVFRYGNSVFKVVKI